MRDAALAVCGAAIVAMLAVSTYQDHRRFHRPLIITPYQAVTMIDGTVFYGRIDHLGSDHPVLREPFRVRHELDAQTQEPRHTLVWRKDEMNGADHIIFPVTSIAFIEPVRPDSTIGRLIEQANLPQQQRKAGTGS